MWAERREEKPGWSVGVTEEEVHRECVLQEVHLVKIQGQKARSWGWRKGSMSGMRQQRHCRQVREEEG